MTSNFLNGFKDGLLKFAAGAEASLIKHYDSKGMLVPPEEWLRAVTEPSMFPVEGPVVHDEPGLFGTKEKGWMHDARQLSDFMKKLVKGTAGMPDEYAQAVKEYLEGIIQRGRLEGSFKTYVENAIADIDAIRKSNAENAQRRAAFSSQSAADKKLQRTNDHGYLEALAQRSGVPVEMLPYTNVNTGKAISRAISFPKEAVTTLEALLDDMSSQGVRRALFRGFDPQASIQPNEHMWLTANGLVGAGYGKEGGKLKVAPIEDPEMIRLIDDNATAHIATLEPAAVELARQDARLARAEGRDTVPVRSAGKAEWGNAHDYEFVADKKDWPRLLDKAKDYDILSVGHGPGHSLDESVIIHGPRLETPEQRREASSVKLVKPDADIPMDEWKLRYLEDITGWRRGEPRAWLDPAQRYAVESASGIAQHGDYTDHLTAGRITRHVFSGGESQDSRVGPRLLSERTFADTPGKTVTYSRNPKGETVTPVAETVQRLYSKAKPAPAAPVAATKTIKPRSMPQKPSMKTHAGGFAKGTALGLAIPAAIAAATASASPAASVNDAAHRAAEAFGTDDYGNIKTLVPGTGVDGYPARYVYLPPDKNQ